MNMMYSPFGGWFTILLQIVVIATGVIDKEQYEEMKRDMSK